MQELRTALTALAPKYFTYRDMLREAGFSCCHLRDNWIKENCSKGEVDLHNRYVVEFARESILSDAPSKILFTDDLNCHSNWLNELKAKRLSEHGPVEKILSSNLYHLIELSPCLRRLVKVDTGLNESSALKEKQALVEEFTRRRSSELELHKKEIESYIKGAPVDRGEIALEEFFTSRVVNNFKSLGAGEIASAQMYGERKIVSFEISKKEVLILLPSVSCSFVPEKGVGGKAGMGFRLADKDFLKNKKFNKKDYVVLHLHALFPNDFKDYGMFSSMSELCLNILAWLKLLEIVLPDVLISLREAVGKRGQSRGQVP